MIKRKNLSCADFLLYIGFVLHGWCKGLRGEEIKNKPCCQKISAYLLVLKLCLYMQVYFKKFSNQHGTIKKTAAC